MITSLLPEILQYVLFFALRLKKSTFPKPLTKNQEQEYFKKLNANNSRNAFEELVKHNLRLVAHVTKKYYISVNDQDDLISIGTIGLIKAVKSFDYNKKIKFATYAARCIENEILMYFRQLKKSANEIYIGDCSGKDEEGNLMIFSNLLISDDDVEEKVELNFKTSKLIEVMNKFLNEREKKVVIYRYGLFNNLPLTQKEVATKLQISRSYVSRIEKKALQTLKTAF